MVIFVMLESQGIGFVYVANASFIPKFLGNNFLINLYMSKLKNGSVLHRSQKERVVLEKMSFYVPFSKTSCPV